MSLANRLNQIIDEQKLSPMLAKVIAMEFGYDAEWILHGDKKV